MHGNCEGGEIFIGLKYFHFTGKLNCSADWYNIGGEEGRKGRRGGEGRGGRDGGEGRYNNLTV